MTNVGRALTIGILLILLWGCEMLRLKDPGMVLYSAFTQTSALHLPSLQPKLLQNQSVIDRWNALNPASIRDPAWKTLNVLTFSSNPGQPEAGYEPGTNFLRLETVDWTTHRAPLRLTPDNGTPTARLLQTRYHHRDNPGLWQEIRHKPTQT
jgi:hypothetical protein